MLFERALSSGEDLRSGIEARVFLPARTACDTYRAQ
jgi:hypothetical protein